MTTRHEKDALLNECAQYTAFFSENCSVGLDCVNDSQCFAAHISELLQSTEDNFHWEKMNFESLKRGNY